MRFDYRITQWAEIWNSLGSWIDEVKPTFGLRTRVCFELTRNFGPLENRGRGTEQRKIFSPNGRFFRPGDLLLMPTSPTLAPLKGTPGIDRSDRSGISYYPRTLSLTAIAGIARLPQISLPLVEIGGIPLGLSLLAPHGRDAFLLKAVQLISSRIDLSCLDGIA